MKTADSYATDFENNPVGSLRKWIIGIIAFFMLIGAGIWVVQIVATPFRTAGAIVAKTLDADNVIGNYEWFKQQYNDYVAIDNKISIATQSLESFKEDLPKDRTKWGFEDKDEFARLASIVSGLEYQQKDIAAKYNARSKMTNRSIFKTHDLPEQL